MAENYRRAVRSTWARASLHDFLITRLRPRLLWEVNGNDTFPIVVFLVFAEVI